MKLSLNWLGDYVDFDLPEESIAHGLTMTGLEVEEIIKMEKGKFASTGGEGKKDDTVFDVGITPNRGDCLSMVGMAREVAVIAKTKVKKPQVSDTGWDEGEEQIKIRIEDPDLCRRYVGIVVKGVKMGEAPGWMKDYLIASGLRPINNIVDITNYVMLELGQPLHAFDLSLVRGGEIIVRRASGDETVTSIDSIERKLDSEMLVIADTEGPVAIAGVMGGENSEINESTVDILIESANFNATSVRRTSKRLQMSTDASYRFERGVDPAVCDYAAKRAAELVCQIAGGEISGPVVDVYPVQVEPIKIVARPERVNAMLGTDIKPEFMAEYLNGYEIATALQDGKLNCTVPTFRTDITREIDLVEEVGRAYGYDNLTTTLPDKSMQGKDSVEGMAMSRIRSVLRGCGMQEVLTHSVIDGKLNQLTDRAGVELKIRNPLSDELTSLRVALAPNLLQTIARNQAFGTPDVSIFELGKVYFNKDGQIGETLAIGGAMVGQLWTEGWALATSELEADFFSCKGVLEDLFVKLGVTDIEFVPQKFAIMHPTRSAAIKIGGKMAGCIGEASPETREALDLRGRPCLFELDFETVVSSVPKVVKTTEIPRFPAMHRHIAAVVADDISYATIVEAARKAGGGLLEDMDLLDLYKGEHIEKGKRSLTLGFTFRSLDKTLTDEEANDALGKIQEALTNEVGATFRG